jgi:hypothetical protein
MRGHRSAHSFATGPVMAEPAHTVTTAEWQRCVFKHPSSHAELKPTTTRGMCLAAAPAPTRCSHLRLCTPVCRHSSLELDDAPQRGVRLQPPTNSAQLRRVALLLLPASRVPPTALPCKQVCALQPPGFCAATQLLSPRLRRTPQPPCPVHTPPPRAALTLHLALGVDNDACIVLKVDEGALLPAPGLALAHDDGGRHCCGRCACARNGAAAFVGASVNGLRMRAWRAQLRHCVLSPLPS